MKKLFTMMMILVGMTAVNAQGLNNPIQGPEFRGGKEKLQSYLDQNIQYPKLAKRQGLEGLVKVNIYIDADGKISEEMKVVKSVRSDLDQEAIRLIRNMPDWIPASQEDCPVGVKYQMAIRFRLD